MTNRNRLTIALLALVSIFVVQTTFAQSRNIGAQSFTLDDGAGHFFTIQAPAGMTGPMSFTFPTTPVGATAGFVRAGTTGGQTLYWNSTNSDWEPSSVITNNNNGDGTNVTITAPLIGAGATFTTLSATSLTGPLTGHASSDLSLTGGTMTGALNMGNHPINALANPSAGTDATTKNYVDAADAANIAAIAANTAATNNEVTRATAAENTKLPLAGGTMTGSINMGTHAITNASSVAATSNGGTTPAVGTVYRDAVPIAWGTINTDGSLANSFGCTYTSWYTPGTGRGVSLLVGNWSSYSSVVVVCSWALAPTDIPNSTLSGWYLGGSWDGTYINVEASNGSSFSAFPSKISFVAYGR